MLQTSIETDGKARYANIHKVLFDAYEKAVEKEFDPLCVERAVGIMTALNALKQDGAVSVDFARNFHVDVAHIIDVAGKGTRPKDRSRSQEYLMYMMINLLKTFGN